jgi:hypothetical protein
MLTGIKPGPFHAAARLARALGLAQGISNRGAT